MARQLHLLLDDGPRDWRLDETTRILGRQGLAQARAALRAARAGAGPAPVPDDDHTVAERTRRSAA